MFYFDELTPESWHSCFNPKKTVSPVLFLPSGQKHLCDKFGVDLAIQAVAVLLIGRADDTIDAVSSASTRDSFDAKVNIIE